MIEKKLKTAEDVRRWRMCVGCGICAPLCPENNVVLKNIENQGIRPIVSVDNCKECSGCIKACPGIGVEKIAKDDQIHIPELKKGWGDVIEVWEGYAADNQIRFNGSSGGLATALAIFAKEHYSLSGVLHVGMDPKEPWKNKTYYDEEIDSIKEHTGSRYSPASPCEGILQIENAEKQSAFIGKPCDVAAIYKARSIRTALNQKLFVTIGIFCAGTPSTKGTIDLLKKHDVDLNRISQLRYRGLGWPGNFTAVYGDSNKEAVSMPYMTAWNFVNAYRPFRCYLCPDGTSELADIACGDPWYREEKFDEEGFSLVLVRTKRGKEIIDAAIRSGAVVLEKKDPSILQRSQDNLYNKRGAIGGRKSVLVFCNIPSPAYKGYYMFNAWIKLSFTDKLSSLVGTIRRVLRRKYFKPLS